MQFGDQGLREFNNQPAIDYFRKWGAEVISIDISGAHGSLPIDLSRKIRWDWYKGYFDIVTNFGTAEHVKDDLMCFNNMLYFCKPNGIMINIAPSDQFTYKYHRRCKRYSVEFFTEWAKTHNCKVIECRITTKEERITPWVLAILQRRN